MTTLDKIVEIDNGAKFLNVDLHIHSYGGSHDVHDTSMTPEAIVDAAVRQSLRVIAITDHNSNINVAAALKYAATHYSGTILVLPGVEVTTAHGHLLAYFPPDDISRLTRFLMRLDLIGEMGADDTRTTKSMADTITEAHKLGGICIAAHIDRKRTGFEAFAPGYQNWKKDIICSPGLYGLECDSVDALTWYSEHRDTGQDGAERKKVFLARKDLIDLAGRPDLARVQGSDSHSMAAFETASPDKSWTRIKLNELTFEALRVALIDPTARVRATASIPRTFPRLRGISIDGGFLDGEMYHFSDNLNCFIGGRGTGKSTAIRALAYTFGLNDEFGLYNNCPDSVTVFCEDDNGICYKYQRWRGHDGEASTESDNSEALIDSFRVEYFGQGDLAKVAEDPLEHPALLQEFLDRHTSLRDLLDNEEGIVRQLEENGGRLSPLEVASAQLGDKRQSLAEVEQKLRIAEEGKLRDVVSLQSRLASEKTVRESVEEICQAYTLGWKFDSMQRDFLQILSTAGACTDDPSAKSTIAAMAQTIAASNAAIAQKERELNAMLKQTSDKLSTLAGELRTSHRRMSAEAVAKLGELRAQGVATDIAGLDALLRQKTSVAREITSTEQRSGELQKCREDRRVLKTSLSSVRAEMLKRRKAQLRAVNSNLGSTIRDFRIFIKYEESGITDQFEAFLKEEMRGSYLQDSAIQALCARISPLELSKWVLQRNVEELAERGGITAEWADTIIKKLSYWRKIFALDVLPKPPKPVIGVRTMGTPPRDIPVKQLSDGQRHTILLTIAMLADTNVPLIIDQPEDDLDNAFISSTVVATLREVKERRQIILVTHNANIAVLGDSELILPMCREGDCGKAVGVGSIDTSATKAQVLGILEGGSEAFRRRRVMYNH